MRIQIAKTGRGRSCPRGQPTTSTRASTYMYALMLMTGNSSIFLLIRVGFLEEVGHDTPLNSRESPQIIC